ncbi:MAG: heparinase II/III family protein [Candidatus Hydrogenedentes bacterium]|nr:heparinase II/III family protein [Candidatus Hydrogenedentota bacterium]
MVPKAHATLYPADLTIKAKANAAAFPWAASMQKELVSRADPWLNMSDDDLWNSIFGPNISRSWMVWSDGFCPACKKDVRMYAWEMEPLSRPWKVRCPRCKETFPKNDFAAYHKSGFDEHGVFQPDKANKALLFNTDHPDPKDSLHMFGVDDGEGYIADGHTWRFIGAYLIYGHWKLYIHTGIVRLGDAYMATGDPRYAYKAAILLDRLADVYPTFDFTKQGLVYETRQDVRGQISTWHDACEEIRTTAQAYDQIFEAAKAQEPALTAYLSKKAEQYRLPNGKKTWAAIQKNIEDGLFVDTLDHRKRIESNYPRTDISLLTLKTVLYWPQNRDEVLSLLDGVIQKATAVDGVSGEKGLAGYGMIAPSALADVLALFGRLEPGFLKTVYERHPVLHDTYRFHIDTKCLDAYYPSSGDAGGFGAKGQAYAGVAFNKNPGINPSMYSFLWDLYKLTDDSAFVQVMYQQNEHKVDGLPYDLLAADPAAFQQQVKAVIDKVGASVPLKSVNKQQWHLAILRSGEGDQRRALWFDYDSGGPHSHADGMNVGYYAKGLDLVTDFGYPPVGYGGWGAPKSRWYISTFAHATVAVDGQNQKAADGKTTLWADGNRVRAVRAAAPEMIGGKRFERTLVMVDLDASDSYVVDCFRVEGGKDHAKFFQSHFGAVETTGLTLVPGEDYGFETPMRNFRHDANAKPGWTADWTIEDWYKYLAPGKQAHLRYIDLTNDADANLAEAWIETATMERTPDWIPRIMTRRRGSDPLQSTFVSVFGAYDAMPTVTGARRLDLEFPGGQALKDTYAGIEIDRADGKRDICLIPDSEAPVEVLEPSTGIHFRGHLAVVTMGSAVERIALYGAEWITTKDLDLRLDGKPEYVEIVFENEVARIAAGNAQTLLKITRNGTAVPVN